MNNARVLALLLAAMVGFVAACNGCEDPGELDPDERIDQLAAFVPDDTEATIVAAEIAEMSEHLDYTFTRLGQLQPDAAGVAGTISQGLGVQIDDAERWETAGFDTDGALLVSMVEQRPVLVAHLEDQNSFETNVIGHLRRELGTETTIDSQVYGDQQFQTSGDGMRDDMAWFVEGSIVVMVMPPNEELDVLTAGTASATANELGELDESDALATCEDFAEFRDQIALEYPIGFRANHEFLQRVRLEDEIERPEIEDVLEPIAQWSRQNIEQLQLGLHAADQTLEVDAFADADDQILEQAREAMDAREDLDWDGLLTENTDIAMRTSLDLQQAVDSHLESLPDAQRQRLETQFERIERDYELDVLDEIVPAFSGHSLMAFYGVHPDAADAIGHFVDNEVFEGFQLLGRHGGLVANFHLADAAKSDRVRQVATEAFDDYLRTPQLTYDGERIEEFELLEPTVLDVIPLRLMTTDNTASLVTAGINRQSAYEYLTNRRDEPLLADADNARLGSQFATAEGINGLYVNFDNLNDSMGRLGTEARMAAGFLGLGQLDELLVTTGIDDDQFVGNSQLTFSDPLHDG